MLPRKINMDFMDFLNEEEDVITSEEEELEVPVFVSPAEVEVPVRISPDDLPPPGASPARFCGDPIIPIYEKTHQPKTTKDVVQIIGSGIPGHKSAKLVPSQPKGNVSFMIDTSYLQHWKDVLSDDLGVWDPNGTKTAFFTRGFHADGTMKVTSVGSIEEAELVAKRYLYVYSTERAYKRVVVKVESKTSPPSDTLQIMPHIFLQYYFEGGVVKEIIVQPHGNSKSGQPFVRTKESTRMKIKDAVSNSGGRTKSKSIVSNLVKEKGGHIKVKSPSDVPRNRMQVSNCRRLGESKPDDDLVTLILKCKEQSVSPEQAYIREVGAAPETFVFLANNWQLNDIMRFCTDKDNCSILGVDMTFNIGAFYVTITVYRHTLLRSRKYGVEPAMIGPILLHQGKSYESYFPLPSLMVKYCPELNELQAVGTDCEKALINAVIVIFQKALHLLCDLHMKDNIDEKMREYQLDPSLCVEIRQKIFGKKVGHSKVPGLVDCQDELEIDQKINETLSLLSQWAVADGFITYFLAKCELIRRTMATDVRARAGLGNPPEMYRQQANESINRVVKRDLDGTLSLPQCAEHLQNLVQAQQEEVLLAMIGASSEYVLKPEYVAAVGCKQIDFYQMNEIQRSKFIKKFNNVKPKSRSILPEPSFIWDEIELPVSNPVVNVPTILGIDDNEVITGKITHIPMDVLDKMLDKAARLREDETAIIRSPSHEIQYFVKSTSNPDSPHLVKIGTQKKVQDCTITCDSSCQSFAGFKICSHTLAVAAKTGSLLQFIDHASQQKSANLLAITNVGMAAGRGRKPKAINKRKYGPASKKKSTKKACLVNCSQSISTSPMGNTGSAEARFVNSSQTISSPPALTGSNHAPCIDTDLLGASNPRQLITPLSKSDRNQLFKKLVIPEQPVVTIGRGQLGPKPPLPEPQNQAYQLLKRKGNISVCNGCGNKFNKNQQALHVIGRTEFDWYIKVDLVNQLKYYKVGGAKNLYYHLSQKCLLDRRPQFDVTSVVIKSDAEVPTGVLDEVSVQFPHISVVETITK